MNTLWGAAALMGLALTVPAGPGDGDDDLAVVKRATHQEAQEPPPAVKADRAAREEKDRPVLRRGVKPQWLRVRVVEKDGRKKVSVNLPLALVRAFGDDFDLGVFCGRHARHHGDHWDRD